MLDELLREPPKTCLTDPDTCLAMVRQIRDSYKLLDRVQVGAEQILELKFATQYWRRSLLSLLCGDPPPPWVKSDHSTLIDIVDALGTRLPKSLVSSLSKNVDQKTIHELMAHQGVTSPEYPQFKALAGPGIDLDITANRDSPWSFTRWKRQSAFRNYEFSGDGVIFRSVHFRPGDVLLANVNLDGNGVYTILSDPTRFSSHSAVFVVIEDDEGRYPAVIETYEKGVRAVPLNVFLSAKFCAYVEVSRHRKLDSIPTGTINNLALDMVNRVRGYNFYSTEEERDYVSCCVVGSQLHRDAGLEPASWKSRIQHPRIRENVAKLDFTTYDFFSPVDYLLDRNFVCAGWVDNYQFENLLARELVEGYYRELFMNRTLNPARFPFRCRLNYWGIRQIRRQSLFGKVIGYVEGFDHRSLPKGPDPLLAVVTVVEAQLGRVVKQTRRWLDAYDNWPEYFSLADFSRRPEVRRYLETELKLRWLE